MNTETAKHTVLIIDDDRLLCEMIREFLSGAALKVLTAHTGREGLALCSQNHIDIVLLDQKLPDSEGYDLCPQIVNFSENAKIIFITAFPSFKNALKAIESGAFSYLTKPFELKELQLAIDKCLRVSELEKTEASLHYQHDKEIVASALVGEKGSMASHQQADRNRRQKRSAGSDHRRDRQRQKPDRQAHSYARQPPRTIHGYQLRGIAGKPDRK